MKVREALNLRSFLENNSKTGKMGNSRVTLVMMLVKLGKVKCEYEALYKSVLEGLKKDVDNFDENLTKAQYYEKSLKDESIHSTWTDEDYQSFMNGDFRKVIEPFESAMRDEMEKEADVEFKKFDEQGFSEWMESNGIDAAKASECAPYLLDM